MTLDRYYIGQAFNEFQIFKYVEDNNETGEFESKYSIKNQTPLIVFSELEMSQKWRIVKKTQISSDIFRFEFTYPGLLIRARVNKIEHFGKHFKVCRR